MIKIDENDPIGEVDPSFPYRDVIIKRNTDMKQFYDLQKEIGRGKFGTVYQCIEKSSGLKLAAKFIGIAKRQDRRNAEREVEIMKELQHPRLIQMYDAYEINNIMCVVLELIEGGELFERVIDDDFILTEKSVSVFMKQICEGVAFIHSKNILHLDMKPENILCLTRNGNRIKIIDFGLARKFDPEKKLQVLFGTPEFVAPEVVNFESIDFGTDMWSVGVICYVLLSGLSPFMGETDVQTMANVTIAQYDFDDEAFNDISKDAQDFISKLLVKNKEERMSATECLSHCWLQRRNPVKNFTNDDDANIQNELDFQKDTLRNIVNRWNYDSNAFNVNSGDIEDEIKIIDITKMTNGICADEKSKFERNRSTPCNVKIDAVASKKSTNSNCSRNVIIEKKLEKENFKEEFKENKTDNSNKMVIIDDIPNKKSYNDRSTDDGYFPCDCKANVNDIVCNLNTKENVEKLKNEENEDVTEKKIENSNIPYMVKKELEEIKSGLNVNEEQTVDALKVHSKAELNEVPNCDQLTYLENELDTETKTINKNFIITDQKSYKNKVNDTVLKVKKFTKVNGKPVQNQKTLTNTEKRCNNKKKTISPKKKNDGKINVIQVKNDTNEDQRIDSKRRESEGIIENQFSPNAGQQIIDPQINKHCNESVKVNDEASTINVPYEKVYTSDDDCYECIKNRRIIIKNIVENFEPKLKSKNKTKSVFMVTRRTSSPHDGTNEIRTVAKNGCVDVDRLSTDVFSKMNDLFRSPKIMRRRVSDTDGALSCSESIDKSIEDVTSFCNNLTQIVRLRATAAAAAAASTAYQNESTLFKRPKYRISCFSRDVPFAASSLSSSSSPSDLVNLKMTMQSPLFNNSIDSSSSMSCPNWSFHIRNRNPFHSDPGSLRNSPERLTSPTLSLTNEILSKLFNNSAAEYNFANASTPSTSHNITKEKITKIIS